MLQQTHTVEYICFRSFFLKPLLHLENVFMNILRKYTLYTCVLTLSVFSSHILRWRFIAYDFVKILWAERLRKEIQIWIFGIAFSKKFQPLFEFIFIWKETDGSLVLDLKLRSVPFACSLCTELPESSFVEGNDVITNRQIFSKMFIYLGPIIFILLKHLV